MDFVIGFAGLPGAIFDYVYSERDRICGSNAEFVARAGKPASDASMRANVEWLLKDFADRVRADHQNQLADTGFAIIAIGEAAHRAAEALAFPSTFFATVDWRLEGESPTEVRQCKNDLVDRLTTATAIIKRVLPRLGKEWKERDSRTPLLLPLRNFTSSTLTAELVECQRALGRGEDLSSAIAKATAAVDRAHPPKLFDDKKRPCYVDDRKVEFHPPGSARHAYARPTGVHPDECFLRGRWRFGAPFDRAFHYDCRKGKKRKLRGKFTCCHHDPDTWEGDPHLNIAPSDFIRP